MPTAALAAPAAALTDLTAMSLTVILWVALVMGAILITFYAERKLSAAAQDRLGPMEAGPYGVLQALADVIKLLLKGPVAPGGGWGVLVAFYTAPLLVLAGVFGALAALPAGPALVALSPGAGLLYLLSIVSIEVAGLWLAGWASGSKLAMLGSMRAIGQMLSYEVPLGLAVLAVAVFAGTADVYQIGMQQGAWEGARLLGMAPGPGGAWWQGAGGVLSYHIIQAPWLAPLLVIVYMAALAESNRAPFDLPEGESELVAGHMTEYAGAGFALFFLAEYALMVVSCVLMAYLFLGGWHSPFPNVGPARLFDWTSGPVWGMIWLWAKVVLLLTTQVWVRWSLPRLRIDQLMHLSWRVLVPAALVGLLLSAVLV